MNNLQTARKNAGFTQVEIAKKIGIATLSYQRYENPKYKRYPDILTAIKIADVLNIKDLRDLWNPKI